MNCNKVQDLLSEAIDGALPAQLARPFQDHIAACPPCRLLFADVKDALSLLAELPSIEVGPEFDDAVRARLRSDRPARTEPRFAGSFARWRDALAAYRVGWAAAAAALLLWIGSSHDTSSTDGQGLAQGSDATTRGDAAAIRVLDGFLASSDAEARSNPELRAVEFTAPMPEAIEVFLGSARVRRLNADQYRRSNYQYPLRAVRDPLTVPLIPVSDGIAPAQHAPADRGIPVLTF